MQVEVILKLKRLKSRCGQKYVMKHQYDVIHNGRTISVDCEEIDDFIEALANEVNDMKEGFEQLKSERPTPSPN